MATRKKEPSDFERAAAANPRGGLAGEMLGFLKSNKKWWLLPILVCLCLFALLILLGSTGLAPFIYTLF